MTKSTWRLLLSMVAIFAVMAVAVACGDDDDDDDDGNGGGGGTTTATSTQGGGDGDEPTEGGELTIQYLDVQSWDPHFSSFAQDIGHHGFVWRGLYRLNKDNEPVAEMAAGEPTVSDDGLTYTVKLKPDLKWSDGDDLTAADFVAGVHRTCDPDNAGQYQYLLVNIVGCDDFYTSNGNPDADPPVPAKSDAEKEALRDAIGVSAPDDLTIEFTLQNQQPTWPIIMTMWMLYPVPTHIVPESNTPWPTDPTTLAFNGPFKLDSYTTKSGAVFSRNDNYAGDHKAYLDKVTFTYIEDNAQANNAFRAGDLDMVLADTAALKAIQAELGDKVFGYAAARTTALQMQMEHEPLDDEKVRLAISHAIDRDTLANDVLQGSVIPTTSWIPTDIIGIAEDEFDDEIGFDPERAAQLMEEAGFPGGEGFPELSITITDTPANHALAEFLQQEFKTHIGIDITISVVDSPTRSRTFREETFDLFPGGWQQDYPDPENWIVGLFDKAGTLNHYNCFDDEIDALIQEAQFNPNNEERLEQYKQVNELISTRACGGPPMYNNARYILIEDHVGGAREFSTGAQDRVIAGDWAPEEWFVKS